MHGGELMTTQPNVRAFFDEATNTVSYVVSDADTARAAVIDPVLDYDPHSGRTATTSADRLIAYVRQAGLQTDWILETHVHADHLSSAPYVQAQLGGKTAIGAHVDAVQAVFKDVFNIAALPADGSQFERLFADGDTFKIGSMEARVTHRPA